jgi:hypothetical protein
MKRLYILGDSHTVRIGHILFESMTSAIKEEPYSTYHTICTDKVIKKDLNGDPLKLRSDLYTVSMDNKIITAAAFLGRPALTFDFNHHDYMNSWDSSENIIMPWLGYIDIKNYLPNKKLKNYKNVNQVIDIYFENVLKKFNNSKIIFVKPMPQFEVIVTARWRNFSSDPNISFEERHEAHLEFCSTLENKCKIFGLNDPIDISNILGVPWVGTTMQYKMPLHYIYNDHCRPEYYKIILDGFLKHINF